MKQLQLKDFLEKGNIVNSVNFPKTVTDNPIPYINLTADELLANPSKYENMAIILTSPVLKEGKGVYSTTYSFQSGENKMPIHLSASIDGRSLPAAGTFTGICDKYNSNYRYYN